MITLRSKKTSTKGYHLYLDYYYKGKREFEFLGMYTTKNYTVKSPPKLVNALDREIMQLAKQILIKRQYDFFNNGYKLERKNKVDISLSAYVEKFMQEKAHKNPISALLSALKRFGKEIGLNEISSEYFLTFQNFLLAEGLSGTSVNVYMSVLKETIKKAIKEELITKNPFDSVDITKKNPKQREYLEEFEIKKLMQTDCENQSIKKAFLFSCFTGLRVSDLRKLLWTEIKEIEGAKYLEIETQKTKKKLLLPLADTAQQILVDIQPQLDSDKVFNFNMSISNSLDILTRWVDKAGISKHITFHSGRTTFAAMCLTSGIDIYTLSKMLTHSSVKTTEIYSRLNLTKAREDINKLPKF